MTRWLIDVVLGVGLLTATAFVAPTPAHAGAPELRCTFVRAGETRSGLVAYEWACDAFPPWPPSIPPAEVGEGALCDSALLSEEPLRVLLRCEWGAEGDPAFGLAILISDRFVVCFVPAPAPWGGVALMRCVPRAEWVVHTAA